VFREFDANVKKDLLANSWRPDNLNAKYPKLDRIVKITIRPDSTRAP